MSASNPFRRKIVGWDCNSPDPFPGFGGMVGLGQDAAKLANGDWLVVFHAGYWHVSLATPFVVAEKTLSSWRASGFPDIDAPRGGRIMAVRSCDAGLTWSRPFTIYDGRWCDAPVGLTRLDGGELLLFVNQQASWYGVAQAPPGHLPVNTRIGVMRSADDGSSWSGPVWLEMPYPHYQRAHAQAQELGDGSVIFPTYAADAQGILHGAIHRSDDAGRSWQLLSRIERDDGQPLDEPSLTLLPDGRLMMLSRLDAAVLFSSDSGLTWQQSHLAPLAPLKAHRTAVLSDGTVVCWMTSNGVLRVSWSVDGGATWATGEDGLPLLLDGDFYGYPGGFLMADESVLVVYYDAANRQQRTSVWMIRFRLNSSRSRLEILPAPGAASGSTVA
jgi:hypothetical protein